MCVSSQLKLLSVAAFFNALSWIILIPIWQYPDEQAHFAQVQGVAELRKRPVGGYDTSYEIAFSEKLFGTERDRFGNNKFTYHPEYRLDYSTNLYGLYEKEITTLPKSSRSQLVKNEATLNPPLYYFLGSLAYRLVNNGSLFDRVYAVRIMSAIIFLATVFVAYKIALLIFKNKILQTVLPTLVAFKPMLVFASTGVLPDPLTNLLFALVVYLSLKILLGGINKKLILKVFFVVVVLGVYTRQQFLISLPIILAAIFYQVFKNRDKLQKYILPTILFTLTGILLAFLVPQLSYVRDLSVPEIGRPNLGLLFSTSFIEHLKVSLGQTYGQTLPWYWGVYRWLSYTLPPIVYQIINRVLIIAIVGVLIAVVRPFVKRKLTDFDKSLYFLIFASFIYYAVIIIWDYYFRREHGFSFGLQGRYLFPLVVAHLSIILIGFKTLFDFVSKRYAKWGIMILVLLMMIFNTVSLFFVSRSYYSVSSIDIFIRHASQYKPEIFKGNLLLFFILISLIVQIVFLFNLFKLVVKNRLPIR